MQHLMTNCHLMIESHNGQRAKGRPPEPNRLFFFNCEMKQYKALHRSVIPWVGRVLNYLASELLILPKQNTALLSNVS